jgi:hypothetical protein
MVVVQGLVAMLTRQASKLLNTVFGWATMLLFGKVPQDKQLALSAISFGSVLWLVVLIGIAFPAVGVFLLSFVPIPRWVDQSWIRIAMVVAAVVIPLIVGLLARRIARATGSKRGEGLGAILRGYPITLGLALTLIMLTLVAPLMQARQIIRRWSTTHVPVIVEPPEYLTVVSQVEKALGGEGMRTTPHRASWMIRVPTKVLTLLAGRAFASFVADQLTVLRGKDFEVMIHPADMVISGKEETATRVRVTIAERLIFSDANLTWTKEANEIEDQLTALWKEMRVRDAAFTTTLAPARLAAIQEQVHQTVLPYEEWEVIARSIARVDEAILAVAAGVVRQPAEVEEMNGEIAAARMRPENAAARERKVAAIVGAVGFGVLTLLGRKMPEARGALRPGNLLAIARMFIR